MWEWVKSRWRWMAGGALALLGLLVTMVTLGKRGGRATRPKGLGKVAPRRPEIEVIEVPEAPEIESRPADKFRENARVIDDTKIDVVANINEKFK